MTIIVPARDEERAVGRCIEALAAQDHPLSDLEVIVVDGSSTDATARVATEALSRHGFGSTLVITNPVGSTPSNLNVGLLHASGDVVVRVDGRALLPPHYVRTVVELLRSRPDIAVTGGSQRALASGSGPLGTGIARALNNRWSMGMSRYRRATRSGPTDTVYLGVFRTSQLREVGGWDERLGTNQDFDLNRRMSEHGTVWYEHGLPVGYTPRATLTALWWQYLRFGRSKVDYWRLTGNRPQRRQLVLVAMPAVGAFVVGAAVVRSRSLRPAAVAAVTGLVALGGVEVAGADGPRAGLGGHLVGAAAIAVTALGWLTGVYRGLVRPGQAHERV